MYDLSCTYDTEYLYVTLAQVLRFCIRYLGHTWSGYIYILAYMNGGLKLKFLNRKWRF